MDGTSLNHSTDLFLLVPNGVPTRTKLGAQTRGRAPEAQRPPQAAMRPRNVLAQLLLASVISPAWSTSSRLGGHRTAKVRARVLPTGTLHDRTHQSPGQHPLGSRPALGGGPDGQGVSLRVEHVSVQAEQVWVVGEEQVYLKEERTKFPALTPGSLSKNLSHPLPFTCLSSPTRL